MHSDSISDGSGDALFNIHNQTGQKILVRVKNASYCPNFTENLIAQEDIRNTDTMDIETKAKFRTNKGDSIKTIFVKNAETDEFQEFDNLLMNTDDNCYYTTISTPTEEDIRFSNFKKFIYSNIKNFNDPL